MRLTNWRFWLLPLIVIIVFFSQLYMQSKGLSRWRGGGFGMYTEVHFDYRQIWVDDSLVKLDKSLKAKKDNLLLRSFKAFPSTYMLAKVRERFDIRDDQNVEIWVPMIEPENFTFYRKRIFSSHE